MASAKMMNPRSFEKMSKELSSHAENVRSKQDQKQIMLNYFNDERRRFQSGRLSKDALASSAKKTNKELGRVNKEIRRSISRCSSLLRQMQKTVSNQAPKAISVSTKGAKGGGKKRRKTASTKKTTTRRTARTSRKSSRRSTRKR